MKYIRTKDNIYELNPPDYESPMCVDGKTITNCVYTKQNEWIPKNTIIKSSNEIVELCDYIFLFDNEITIRRIVHEDDYYDDHLTKWLKECVELGFEVKLAIPTDKGLIYVAEMNKDGKLCLI